MFLEPTCTSECLKKSHLTTFINLQTYKFLAFLKENILWIITVSPVLPKIHGGLLLQTSTVVQTEDRLSLKKEIDFGFSSKLVRTRIWQKPSSWSSRVGLPYPSQKVWVLPPFTSHSSSWVQIPVFPSHSLTLKEKKKEEEEGELWIPDMKNECSRILQGQSALTFLLASSESAAQLAPCEASVQDSFQLQPVWKPLSLSPSFLNSSPKCPWRVGLRGSHFRLRLGTWWGVWPWAERTPSEKSCTFQCDNSKQPGTLRVLLRGCDWPQLVLFACRCPGITQGSWFILLFSLLHQQIIAWEYEIISLFVD